jgi:uncharacterized protein (TIGR03492 family)
MWMLQRRWKRSSSMASPANKPVEPKKLLVISNGHGEDSIGAAIVRQLPATIQAQAYPTLGPGAAYDGVCAVVGPRAHLQSSGSRVASGTFARDVRGGMLATIAPGLGFGRQARRAYDDFLIIGDFVGVLGCWLSGIRNIVWVDVYKTGFGRGYSAIERLIIRRTCRLAFVRHASLADDLKSAGIAARAAGNVMMDTIPRAGLDLRPLRSRPLALALLPGSRAETAANFALQIEALRRLPKELMPDLFLALAPGLDSEPLAKAAGLRASDDTMTGDVTVRIVRGALGDVLDAADVVFSQAGTAAVQAVGLGKPVISFTRSTDRMSRHRDETALFGDARILVRDDATELSQALAGLLSDPADRLRRGATGRERIGPPGAMAAIVAEVAH